ncbi:hypothetical protein M231_05876 [Tremella mesenterica]|uniref:Amidase domain-containing protein n=1 Tax=Tremella mesenterica TaxID=5217 RepID=A0A4Q1BGY6_TREME|nr:hypothetical protein M231_05876 [Tremella mesenterica]
MAVTPLSPPLTPQPGLIPAPKGVTTEEMYLAAEKLKFTIPEGHKEDYMKLLAKTDAAAAIILSQEDYKPKPDFDRFPRTNVHLPKGADNPNLAFAWRADIGDPVDSTGKLLSGKKVVFKDTIAVAGVPLVFGTNAFENYIPDVDATVVTRVLENGGHVLGKAACENFSHGASSSSSPYGPVENPYAYGFSAGGSSSGCGSLIGAGVADMGIGGDQGGSIRIPASLCGIVGLKPTFGLVPYTGVLTSDAGVDHVGPMARTVLDTARLLQAVAGYDKLDDRQLGAPLPENVPKYPELVLDSRPQGVKGMHIGVLKEGFLDPSMSPDLEKVVRAAIEKFKELGAIVEEVSAPTHKISGSLSHIINKFASGGTRQGRQVGRRGLYMTDYWAHLLPWTQEKYDKAKYYVSGTAMSCEYGWVKYPTAYGKAQNVTRRLRDEYDALFEKYDAIVMPTNYQPARRHIPVGAGPLVWNEVGPGITANTAASNLTGHPSMTFPVGFTSPMPADVRTPEDAQVRLPVGLMIMGKLFDETTVLKVGDAWEQAYDWKVQP